MSGPPPSYGQSASGSYFPRTLLPSSGLKPVAHRSASTSRYQSNLPTAYVYYGQLANYSSAGVLTPCSPAIVSTSASIVARQSAIQAILSSSTSSDSSFVTLQLPSPAHSTYRQSYPRVLPGSSIQLIIPNSSSLGSCDSDHLQIPS